MLANCSARKTVTHFLPHLSVCDIRKRIVKASQSNVTFWNWFCKKFWNSSSSWRGYENRYKKNNLSFFVNIKCYFSSWVRSLNIKTRLVNTHSMQCHLNIGSGGTLARAPSKRGAPEESPWLSKLLTDGQACFKKNVLAPPKNLFSNLKLHLGTRLEGPNFNIARASSILKTALTVCPT